MSSQNCREFVKIEVYIFKSHEENWSFRVTVSGIDTIVTDTSNYVLTVSGGISDKTPTDCNTVTSDSTNFTLDTGSIPTNSNRKYHYEYCFLCLPLLTMLYIQSAELSLKLRSVKYRNKTL